MFNLLSRVLIILAACTAIGIGFIFWAMWDERS